MKTNQSYIQFNQRLAGLFGLSVLLAVASAHATGRVWNGGGTDNYWTTPANWVGSTAPAASGDSLEFGGTAGQNNTNDFLSLDLSNGGTPNRAIYFDAGGWVLNGNPVSLSGAIGNAGGDNVINLDLLLTGVRSFYIADGQLTVNGSISGAYGLATAGGSTASSTLVLGGINTFSGGLTINRNAANVRITNPLALGTGTISIPKQGTDASGYLQLDLTGVNIITNNFAGFRSTTGSSTAVPDIENISGMNTLTSPLTVTSSGGNGLMVQSDAGLLTLDGQLSTTVDKYRYVQLYGDGDGVVNGVVGVTSGSLSAATNYFGIQKRGTGTWTLNGANTTLGTVYIYDGTLALGASGSLSNTPSINMNSTFDVSAVTGGWVLNSGQTLQGKGAVLGDVATASSGTSLQPGAVSSPGTTVGLLSFSNSLAIDNTALHFNLSSDPTGVDRPSDLITVTGDLNASGTNTFVLGNYVNGFIPNGTYALIKFSGALIGDARNFAVTNFSTSSRGTQGGYIITNTGEIDLVVTGTPPANLVWVGDGVNNYWDINTSSNWLNGGNLDAYYDNDAVTFDDTSNNYTVYIPSTVSPGSVTINTTNDYNISGSDISGITGLEKLGSGTATISSYNTFTGVTTYGGGSIAVQAIGDSGLASPVGEGDQILDGGTLEYTGSGESNNRGFTIGPKGGTVAVDYPGITLTFTKSGVWASSGNTFTKTGPGTLAFSYQQNLNGTNIVAGGILQIPTVGLFGTDLTTPLFVTNGELDLNGQSMSSKPVVISGMGDPTLNMNSFTTNGAIINTGADQINGAQYVTLAGDAAIGGTSRWDIRGNPGATLSTDGHAYNLVKAGANQISLVNVAVDPMLADVDVQAGTLSMELQTTGLGNPANTLTVENGATFNLYSATNELDKQIVLKDYSILSASSGSNTIVGPVNMPADSYWGPTFNVATNATLNISGVVSGPGTITLDGGGKLILSAPNNSYGGSATVNAGELVLSSALTNTSYITINDGSGLGVIVSGTSQLSPSYLQLGSSSGSAMTEFSGVSSTTTAPINTPYLYLNVPTTINITSGNFVAGQSYPLVTYGSMSGAGGFTLGSLPTGVTGNLVTNGNTIALSVSSVYVLDVWTAAVDSNWDIGGTANWLVNGAAGTYADGNLVQFNDSANNANVNVTTTVAPGGIMVNNTLKNYVFSGGSIGGSGSLTKEGSGPLTLANANTYTGGTVLSAGTLNINDPAALGATAATLTINGGALDNTSGSPITLANNNAQDWNGNFTFAGTQDLNLGTGAVTLGADSQVTVTAGNLTVGGDIGDGGATNGLAKAGDGTLTLGGATKNYGGATAISAGTLKVMGGGLPTNTLVAFANSSSTATLDLTGLAQTVGGMTFGTQTTGANTISILGDPSTSLALSSDTLLFAPVSSAGDLNVDMSSLGSFTYSNATGTVTIDNGNPASAAGTATVTLAGGFDSITATALNIADRGGSSYYVQTSELNLGSNSVLNVDNIGVGSSGSRANGMLTAGAGTLVIRGSAGGDSDANLTVGRSDSWTSTHVTTSLFDASPGTLDAMFGSVVLGSETAGSTSARGITINAAFNMGAGALTANTVTLGNLSGSYAGGTYSITSRLNLNGPGTANITNLVVADEPATGGPTLTMDSQVNLNGGATLNAASIGQGNVANVTTLTSQINWTNGTIGNISGSDLSIGGVNLMLHGDSTFNIDATSTGSSVSSVISGEGNLSKSGAGTLTLSAANSYTGDTAVSAGTLALDASGSIANSTNIIIAGGATFDVSATAFALASGQSLGNSSSMAQVNGSVDASSGALGLTYASGTPALSMQNGSLTLAPATVVTVNNTGAPLGNGSFKLISAGTGGTVGGTVPSAVAVTGSGVGTGGTASLNITGNELYLDVSGVVAVNTNSPVLTNTVSGSTLTLSWPADHLGWRLEVQTNALNAGLGTNWVTWPNSTNMTSVPIAVDPANPTMFFRLVYP